MKNMLISILLLASVTVFAQDKDQRRGDSSNDEMATLRAKRLAMQLDLNGQQETRIKALFLKRIEAPKGVTEQREREKIREERMKMNEEMKEELQDILTEEQYLKWEQLLEKRRKGRRAINRQGEN